VAPLLPCGESPSRSSGRGSMVVSVVRGLLLKSAQGQLGFTPAVCERVGELPLGLDGNHTRPTKPGHSLGRSVTTTPVKLREECLRLFAGQRVVSVLPVRRGPYRAGGTTNSKEGIRETEKGGVLRGNRGGQRGELRIK